MVMDRSAIGPTPVLTVEVLLVGSGSDVGEVIVALLSRVALTRGAVTTTVTVGAEVAVARVGRVQVTEVLPTFVQVQPVPAAETNVTPAGRVSVTETLVASEGPLLVATRV